MMTVEIDQVFEQISEMISVRRPFEKKDIERMVEHFSIEKILILAGRLAFFRAEKKERYAENINDIRDQAVHLVRDSLSGFYDEDASLQFIGSEETKRRIDEVIDFLYQISKDLF